MKVLILALAGSDGDIHPHLGIGQELMARGHKVVFFCQEQYSQLVQRYGFEFENTIGQDETVALLDQLRARKHLGKLKHLHESISTKIFDLYNAIISRIDDETVMISDPFGSIIARFINEKYGTPYTAACFMPASLFSITDPPIMKETRLYRKMPYPLRSLLFFMSKKLLIDPVFGTLFNKIIQEQNRTQRSFSFTEWIYSSPNMLGLFPEWYGPTAKDWPTQLVRTGFPLFSGGQDGEESTALARFLNSGDAPVIFTPGSRSSKRYEEFFEAAVSALQSLGLRGLFLARSSEQIPRLPSTIHYEKYVPLNLVLPRSKAFVHHGGIGTTAQALFSGTPQLFIPGNFDQFDNAHIVESLGCGIELKKMNNSGLTESLHRLLVDQEIKQNCLRVREKMEPGHVACGRAADVIEQTLWNKRGWS